jgi:hypothetical protein
MRKERMFETLKGVFLCHPFTVKEAIKHVTVSRSYFYKALHEMVSDGLLTKMGRGIYLFSDSRKAILSVTPTEIAQKIKNLLSLEGIIFVVSGLDILLSFTHLLLVRFPHLIYTQDGSEEWAKETLETKQFFCLINPQKREIDMGMELSQDSELVILRPTASFYASEEGIASPERALVDLYCEVTRKGYPISLVEISRIFFNTVKDISPNYPMMLRYATRRGVEEEIILLLQKFRKNILIPFELVQKRVKVNKYTKKLNEIGDVILR